MRGYLFAILSGMILILVSCAPQTCYENTDAEVKAYLYKKSTNTNTAPDSITIYGLNMESDKLYDKSINVKSAILPLDISTSACKYVIRINGVNDTLGFGYDNFPYLISKECGYTYYHNLNPDSLTYTTHKIISISVIKSSITNLNEENIRIYY
ncbi:MAG TPA: DUF6452 family protein [Bacteroidales bacterium]|nr:DUF6452 family protein [Bacteroidales bacterium]